MGQTFAYLRVSTSHQDVKNQRFEILDYSQRNGLRVDHFIEVEMSSRKGSGERMIDHLLQRLNPGDSVIVSELSRIGRSTVEVLNIVKQLTEMGVALIAIKQNMTVSGNGNVQSKVMVTLFSLFAELERDLISERTKRALEAKKAAGVKIGRPKGRTSASKLDGVEEQIRELLRKKVSMASISKIFEVSRGTVYNFIHSRKLRDHDIGRAS
ncbi:resolvase-like serine recombinase [Geotalea daltonii FRC-32]|uniref:Resolvase-like serine recombinase n=1 Tax=Geotalea daltonii (strain DSM 22248 / JCM 15807 / FRC-32) TaxID=316067 RepID=B9M0C1_GEODF|nr:recombinase family protein [Geotalea daltonii]ACM18958.1 resolvase-like serine recombinase [Geotalea daltonii FRC-32]